MTIKGGMAALVDMSISGPEAKAATMQVTGPNPTSGNVDLRIAADPVFPITLFIGNRSENNNVDLYVTPPISTTAAGFTAFNNIQTLAVSGTANSGHNQDFNVFISGPTGVPSENAAANFSVKAAPLEVQSGVLNMAVVADGQQIMPLTMPSNVENNQAMNLYIERDFANALNLSIKHKMASGVADMAVSGAFFATGNMDLVIPVAFASGMNFNMIGYLE